MFQVGMVGLIENKVGKRKELLCSGENGEMKICLNLMQRLVSLVFFV